MALSIHTRDENTSSAVDDPRLGPTAPVCVWACPYHMMTSPFCPRSFRRAGGDGHTPPRRSSECSTRMLPRASGTSARPCGWHRSPSSSARRPARRRRWIGTGRTKIGKNEDVTETVSYLASSAGSCVSKTVIGMHTHVYRSCVQINPEFVHTSSASSDGIRMCAQKSKQCFESSLDYVVLQRDVLFLSLATSGSRSRKTETKRAPTLRSFNGVRAVIQVSRNAEDVMELSCILLLRKLSEYSKQSWISISVSIIPTFSCIPILDSVRIAYHYSYSTLSTCQEPSLEDRCNILNYMHLSDMLPCEVTCLLYR